MEASGLEGKPVARDRDRCAFCGVPVKLGEAGESGPSKHFDPEPSSVVRVERGNVHFNWLASFERRARNVHEEIEGAT